MTELPTDTLEGISLSNSGPISRQSGITGHPKVTTTTTAKACLSTVRHGEFHGRSHKVTTTFCLPIRRPMPPRITYSPKRPMPPRISYSPWRPMPARTPNSPGQPRVHVRPPADASQNYALAPGSDASDKHMFAGRQISARIKCMRGGPCQL